MVKKLIDKRNYIILGIIIILILFIVINLSIKIRPQLKSYNYFNENIVIETYSIKNNDKAFSNIDKIYKKYNKLYEDKTVYKNYPQLLKYGQEKYKETSGLIDISSNKLLEAVMNDENYDFKTEINNLNETNLNVDSIIGAYSSKEVEDYLKSQKIDKYLINEDGNIIAGKRYHKDKYKISISGLDNKIIRIVKIENESLSIKGNVNVLKPYMINPLTSSKNSENKLIVVIAKDINEANMLANTLYLMSLEEGMKFIQKYKAEAMWQTSDGKIHETKNFKKYEK